MVGLYYSASILAGRASARTRYPLVSLYYDTVFAVERVNKQGKRGLST